MKKDKGRARGERENCDFLNSIYYIVYIYISLQVARPSARKGKNYALIKDAK